MGAKSSHLQMLLMLGKVEESSKYDGYVRRVVFVDAVIQKRSLKPCVRYFQQQRRGKVNIRNRPFIRRHNSGLTCYKCVQSTNNTPLR